MFKFTTKICIIVIIFAIFFSVESFANDGNANVTAKSKAKANFSKMKKDDFIKLNKKNKRASNDENSKIQKAQNQIKQSKKESETKTEIKKNDNQALAANKFWVPGEFDESQAVLISWPSMAYDEDGQPLEPFMDGLGKPYDGRDTLLPIAGYETDLYTDSPFPPLYKELINAIQAECQVWIRLTNIEDTTQIKNYMKSVGYQLKNYIFFKQPEGENSFWMRDCGPYGFYYGDKDSLGLIGAQYYPGRPIDNDISKFLANKFGYKYLETSVETEGGNFMTDGWGRAFWSNVIVENNADPYGRAYESKKPMTAKQVNDSMKYIFNLDNYSVLSKLQCDGGTGHIDLYLKLVDDETIITTEYPEAMNISAFPDYKISKRNLDTIRTLNSHYGRKFTIKNLPLPTKDDGTYPKNCFELFSDARTYINGLSVNKTFIMPIYSTDVDGNMIQDDAAVKKMQEYLPGYTIYPIDARALSTGGGEIHCITMQIPATNPLRIAHQRLSGFTALKPEWAITVNAINNSGIKSTKLFWKKQSEKSWKTIDMEAYDINDYKGVIPGTNVTINDSINYYIEVVTNNGKSQNRPISAPLGYYTYFFKEVTGVENNTTVLNNTFKVQPNPVNDIAKLSFNLLNEGNYKIEITNSLGEKMLSIPEYKYSVGDNLIEINTNNFASGIYYITLLNGNILKTIPMIVVK
jgi:agmatine deiminase